MTKCSMRSVLRHGQFVDLARKLLSKLVAKSLKEGSMAGSSANSGESHSEWPTTCKSFDFADYSDSAPPDVRIMCHAILANWPRFQGGFRRPSRESE